MHYTIMVFQFWFLKCTKGFLWTDPYRDMQNRVRIPSKGWMATHYMCSLGEMVGAALPSGMKLESTTRIVLHPNAADTSESGLDDQAMMLLDALHVREDM